MSWLLVLLLGLAVIAGGINSTYPPENANLQ